jgi:hypothetical protein
LGLTEPPAAERRSEDKDLEFSVSICIEEGIPNDPEILVIFKENIFLLSVKINLRVLMFDW